MEAQAEGVSAPDRERYLGLDCEMVGVGADGKRSALARVTMVDFDGRVVYDEHVRPVERVTDFRTWVSGVKAKHLKEAISLKEVRAFCIGEVPNTYPPTYTHKTQPSASSGWASLCGAKSSWATRSRTTSRSVDFIYISHDSAAVAFITPPPPP